MSEQLNTHAELRNFTRMPEELVEVMSEISDKVIAKLGEMSIVSKMADDLPPVQAALLKASLEQPGFVLRSARKRHKILNELPGSMIPFEKVQLEESLYEKGVTAKWHGSGDPNRNRARHELVIYYVKHPVNPKQ